MSAPQKFRSAFNGFNREDVAGYLEYLNSKHTAQINQLTSEADFLRSQLENTSSGNDQSAAILSLEQERDELKSQLEELQTRFDTLQERCAVLEQDAAKQESPAVAPPVCSPAEELEIYRRAERTERMARERADLIFRQTNGVLAEASVRVSDMADQVVPIADQILVQIGQLQQTVTATKQSLQDAAIILGTLRSDNH